MMCARCDQPIAGKPEPVDKMSPSGPGSTVYIHPDGRCKKPPTQTAPTPRLRRH